MPPAKTETSPDLGIIIDNLGRPYRPGDIITGRVTRQAHVVCPMAIAEIWLLGRTKVKLGVTRSNGQSTYTTYYRGRFNHFDRRPQQIHAGPLHIPPGGPVATWAFALEIPTQMSPQAVLSDHKDAGRGSFVPLNHTTIQAQPVPGSFLARGSQWKQSKDFVCYVEYHVEAALTLQGRHGKALSATLPVHVQPAQPPAPPRPGPSLLPTTYGPGRMAMARPQCQACAVSTFRLAPGLEDVHLSWKQKTQKLFHSSKVPSLGLRLYVDAPSAIQLGGGSAPVPFQIRLVPDRPRSSEVVHDTPQTALLTALELILKANTSVLANGSLKTYECHDTVKHRILLPCLSISNSVVDDAPVREHEQQDLPGYEETETSSPAYYPRDVKQRLPTPPPPRPSNDEKGPLPVEVSESLLPNSPVRQPPGESSASGPRSPRAVVPGASSKQSGLRLPIQWGPEASNNNSSSSIALDVGTLMDLRFFSDRIQVLQGNQSSVAAAAAAKTEGGPCIYPDFTSFGIKHEHALKWKMTLELAGEKLELEGEQPVTVFGPSAEQ